MSDCLFLDISSLIKAFLFPVLQDSMSALVHDLNFPPLRKNKNIEAFLSRCEFPRVVCVCVS